MKAILSIFVGLMLLTSLVGISYATPLQPLQSSGDVNACVNLKPTDPAYYGLGCAGAAHQGGDENKPPHQCVFGRTDGTCCVGTGTHGLEVSDIHPDLPCQR